MEEGPSILSEINQAHFKPAIARKSLSCPPNSEPFQAFSVAELSLVSDLSAWSNTQVCSVGKLKAKDDCIVLQSNAEDSETAEIKVNLSIMKEEPKCNIVVQLFGEIFVDDQVPVLKGFFFRNFESVDLGLYNKALKMRGRFVPLFLSRKRKLQEFDDYSDMFE